MLIRTVVVLTLVVVTSLQIHDVTSDDDPCGGSCTEHGCCRVFDTSRLVHLSVSVDCSPPSQPIIVQPGDSLNESSAACAGYHLYHTHSCLTRLPDSYCRYNKTRAIEVFNNNIAEFPDLQCLPLLIKLDLQYNQLRTVPEHAFTGVSYLREIWLDHNEISYIHPKAFDADLPNLQIVSVSYNQLSTIEGGALALLHPFCMWNFSHNAISRVDNSNNFTLNPDLSYGPGFVDLSYNLLREGPMAAIRALGVRLRHLAKFLKWGFDARHNPFRCDCDMFGVVFFLKLLIRGSAWREYYNVRCASPARFNGTFIYDLPLEQLTCDVTQDCPDNCRCEKIPKLRTTSVDCQSAGLRTFPHVMPKGKRLALNMTHNSLNSFPAREYLSRTHIIDLRGNGLTEMEDRVPHLLREAKRVDLRDNQLLHLPDTLQVMPPKALLLDLHTLRCSCNLRWVRDWLRFNEDHSHLDNITCNTQQGTPIYLASASKEDLGCVPRKEDSSDYEIALIIGSILVLGVGVLLVVFRYELLVLGQHLAARRKTPTPVANSKRHQVFVSLRAESAEDSMWARQVLVPALDQLGLSSFLPPRDCLLGSVQMDEVTKQLQHSAAALVLLSPDYVEDGPCLFQFARAYSHMLANRHGPLLLLQLRPVSRRAARDRRLRAMLTLRLFHSADNQHLQTTLARLLPAPTVLNNTDNTALNNTDSTAVNSTDSTAVNITDNTAPNNIANTARHNTFNTARNKTTNTALNNPATHTQGEPDFDSW